MPRLVTNCDCSTDVFDCVAMLIVTLHREVNQSLFKCIPTASVSRSVR